MVTDPQTNTQADSGDYNTLHHSFASAQCNNFISIAPYGCNFRGAGGRSDQCSVKAGVNKEVLSLDLNYAVANLAIALAIAISCLVLGLQRAGIARKYKS